MDVEKRKRLVDAGFEFGTVSELLGLSEEEQEMLELRLTLSRHLKERRLARNLSQVALDDGLKQPLLLAPTPSKSPLRKGETLGCSRFPPTFEECGSL